MFAITALTQAGGVSAPAVFHVGPYEWVHTNTSHSKALISTLKNIRKTMANDGK